MNSTRRARLVYDAWTKPELVKRWLYGPEKWTLAVCDMEVRPGGKIRWVWRDPDGKEMGLKGVYHEVVPPERLVHTELFDEDWTGGETLVTITFTEKDGKTTCAMTVLLLVQGRSRRRPQDRHGGWDGDGLRSPRQDLRRDGVKQLVIR